MTVRFFTLKPWRHRLVIIGFSQALALVIASPTVFAQPGSPLATPPEFSQALPQLRQQAAPDAWRKLQDPPTQWLDDPEYHYWRGVFALDAAQWLDARDSFERALMLDPDHAGALYDYGFSLCRLGERQSCQVLLEAARQRHGLPPALGRQRRQLLLAEVRAGGGYSSNLNRAPLRDILTVQLDGASLDLQLSADSRPRSGSFVETGLDLRLINLESGLKIGGAAYQRTSPGQSRVNLVNAEVKYPVAKRHNLGVGTYSLSEGAQRGIQAAGGQWEWLPGGAWKRLGVSAERRHLTESGARYNAIRLDSQYQLRADWALGGFLENEGRSAKRAGEGSRRLGVSLQHQWSQTPLGDLETVLRYSHGRDHAPYSPLFGDAVRTISQGEFNLRLTTPFVGTYFQSIPRPKLRTDLRTIAQRSNLALFDLNEWQLQLSLVWDLQK